jgi:hypothetical protein
MLRCCLYCSLTAFPFLEAPCAPPTAPTHSVLAVLWSPIPSWPLPTVLAATAPLPAGLPSSLGLGITSLEFFLDHLSFPNRSFILGTLISISFLLVIHWHHVNVVVMNYVYTHGCPSNMFLGTWLIQPANTSADLICFIKCYDSLLQFH